MATRESIFFKYNGVEMEIKPDDPEYTKFTKAAESKLDERLADARVKLETELKATIKAKAREMQKTWSELPDDKRDDNANPKLVLANWALGIWFDGSPAVIGKLIFVPGTKLQERERALRSDAGTPKS